MSHDEGNKLALKKFYERKDPNRVKNVEPLFLRFEEADILWFVEHKYGEAVEGWVEATAQRSDASSVDITSNTNRRSQGFFGSAKSLISIGSQKNVIGARKSIGRKSGAANGESHGSFDSRISRADSDDSEATPLQSALLLPPQSPMAKVGSLTSMTEKVIESGDTTVTAVESRESTPSPSPDAHVSASPEMTKEQVDAKLDEIARKEKDALEQAREEERRIQEALARGREAIERAKRELAEKEQELIELRRLEALKHAAGGSDVTKQEVAPAMKKAEEAFVAQQFEALDKLEKAEVERITLEEQEQRMKIEEYERQAKLDLIETMNSTNMGGEDDEDEETKGEDEDKIVGLPNIEVEQLEGSKRVTLYERKLQAALEASASVDNEETGGRKTVLGGLVDRFTKSSKRKTTAPIPPQQSPSPPAVSDEMNQLPPVPILSETDSPPSSEVITPPSALPPGSPVVVQRLSTTAVKTDTPAADSAKNPVSMDGVSSSSANAIKPQVSNISSSPVSVVSSDNVSSQALGPARRTIVSVSLSRKTISPAAIPTTTISPADTAEVEKWRLRALEAESRTKILQQEAEERTRKFQQETEDRIRALEAMAMNAFKSQQAATAAAAAAASSSSASSASAGEIKEENGYKVAPRDHPDLAKYQKMTKAGLPQGAIENAMIRDGFHPKSMFDQPLNNPAPLKKAVPAAAAPAPAPVAAPSAPPVDGEFRKLPADAPELEKYKKMQKAGLPQGAIENAMMRDFIHPFSVFGKDAFNDPKPKAPAAAAKAPAAVSAPQAKSAAPAAPVDPSKPPPGMSMMEEMKWRQQNKAKEPPKQFVEPVKKVEEKPAAVAAPPGPNDKPPPGLSMMEEMKWKQAQKAAIAAANGGPTIKEPPKKEIAPAAAPAFKSALKPGDGAKAPASAATTATKAASPAWSKPPPKAVMQAATNLAAAPPPPNVDAIVALLVGAKISGDSAKKYATALAREGFDSPDKLALIDESDLTACGITIRFDIKTIMGLKNNLPKPAAPASAPGSKQTPASSPLTTGKGLPGPAASKAATPVAAPPSAATATKPGATPSATAAKPPTAAAAAPKPSPLTSQQKAPLTAVISATNGLKASNPVRPVSGGWQAGHAALPHPEGLKPLAITSAATLSSTNLRPQSQRNLPPVAAAAPAAAGLKNSKDAASKRDAERLAFVLALGAPMDSYKKPKQIG